MLLGIGPVCDWDDLLAMHPYVLYHHTMHISSHLRNTLYTAVLYRMELGTYMYLTKMLGANTLQNLRVCVCVCACACACVCVCMCICVCMCVCVLSVLLSSKTICLAW